MTDYHDFSHRGTPKEKRKTLNIGDIYCNAIECKKCGWYIRSRNRRDMVSCKCGSVSIDGGSWYTKVSGDLDNVIFRTEYFDDAVVHETVTEKKIPPCAGHDFAGPSDPDGSIRVGSDCVKDSSGVLY